MDLDRAAALGLGLACHMQTQLARFVFTLLVAQSFEPDKHLDLARAVALAHVAQVTLVHQAEVLGTLDSVTHKGWNVILRRPVLRQALEHRVAL
jgi:hypothetical protein